MGEIWVLEYPVSGVQVKASRDKRAGLLAKEVIFGY